ncbi:invasion associated locus B family protein [Sphingomonas bacterium]|uniref:invasion associated locus B family protein n=1 Tax=Sphingomonas bacterium TaxID=1895847 RepID=UPI002606382B|nr:invasion associated locus B family protein [Sphingomonas bacterium]
MLALLLLAAASGREAIGVYGGWGAFRDASPRRCFAIARPIVGRGRATGFASVANWPGRGLSSSLHIRLSRARDRSAGVTLSVGERRFALVANTADAWAADAPSDRAIVAALRSGRSMSVEAVGLGGRPFADTYALAGAATAIDAAALACAAR